MDKIEKIKEWVKKEKKETLARNSIGVITGKALFVDANELLSFLDTLSKEPDKSLEKEIDLWISENENIHHGDRLMVWLLKEVARYFAKWGAEHLRDTTKMTDKSLDEAAENAMPKEPAYFADEFTEDGPKSEPVYDVEQMKAMYKAGVEWQKEQMLKDAIPFYEILKAVPPLERENTRIIIVNEEE